MSLSIILQIILLSIALAMDAFSVALVKGLTIKDINKKRSIFIAASFGIMQAIMPLIGFWVVELVSVGAGQITSKIVIWVAFASLLFIGGKMLFESIKGLVSPPEEKKEKLFSYKEIIIYSILTAIDAFAAGITMHTGLSTGTTIWLHVTIVMAITFALSLVGLFLGKQIIKLLKGRYEISTIIGGSILILFAIWIVVSHYLGI